MSTTIPALITAKEFAKLPDNRRKLELVRGRIVPVNMPTPRHGEICVNTIRIVGNFLEHDRRGRLVSNDAGILTEQDPDTVRGADIASYSFERVPEGPLPDHYLDVPPEVVFEVKSQGDRWRQIHIKVAEYLRAGVTYVCVLDEQTMTAHIFHSDQAPRILTADQELHLPEVLGDFRAFVRRFFA
jgi:Uma2 family endonuclease